MTPLHDRVDHRHDGSARRIATALLATACLLALAAPAALGFTSQLRRYPYLTDAAAGGVTVNWATDRTLASGSLTWGVVGTESCTAHTVTAARTSITVNGVAEYQWSARLALGADTRFCYRVFGDTVDLLGSDASPQSVTQLPASSSAPFSFAVFGDWGLGVAGGNPGQAGVMRQIAASGARFALATGDTAYPSGSQTNYGDLVQTGSNVSGVFGPASWAVPGATIPLFSAAGNHGLNTTFLSMWPTSNTAAASNGSYAMQTYCCTNGTRSASYPSAWYAFDQGTTRLYILDAAWGDTNPGTASTYENDYDNHWTPSSPEYRWLESDMATHPSELKLAVWHYPLYVDNSSEPSDTFLQGAGSLEGLLHRYGVAIGFNGHAHVYERNRAASNGLVTYVTGGGGARVEPVNHCKAIDAYAIGWSNSSAKGSACGAATRPTSSSQVFHFLLVRVDGRHVTVTPTDSTGRTFDVQSYDFPAAPPPPDTTAPSAPTGVSASAVSPTRVDVSWNASSDNVGVAGYRLLRNGTQIANVTAGTSFSDTAASPGTTYTYAVTAYDAAGNTSAPSSAPPVTTPTSAPGVPTFVREGTGSTLSGTTFDVPIASTTGDALVASIAIQAGTTASVAQVIDSAGNTWTKGPAGLLAGSSTRIELWYSTGAAAVDHVTVTLSTAKAASANVAEFEGVASSSALDASAGAGTASSTTAATPSIATTHAADVIVGAINYPGSASSTLSTPGATALSSFPVSTVNGRAAYRIVSATGTWSFAWTLSAVANSGGAILALKGA